MKASLARATLPITVLTLLLTLPAAVLAQAPERSRFSGSVAILNTQPLGELRTGPGVGLAASGAFALDASRIFRIRGDLRLASYGHEDRRLCLGGNVGCWIQLDVNTDYTMVYGGLGPEVALPVLGTELVLDATAGLGYFGVSSSLQGIDDSESFGTTRHYDDTVFAWSAGGALRIPVARAFAIDLGTHYVHNGRASYVVEGGISENPDGSLDIRPVTTDANVVAITVGVAFRPVLDRGGR